MEQEILLSLTGIPSFNLAIEELCSAIMESAALSELDICPQTVGHFLIYPRRTTLESLESTED